MMDRLKRLSTDFDEFRSTVVNEPRGSDVLVGALLLEPMNAASAAGVIFFNNVGYLGMCGHGTIGVVTTLAHLGRMEPGKHRLETPVGEVSTELHSDGRVTVENVPSYRYRKDVRIEVPHFGIVHGDVAWGGNWFFLTEAAPALPALENRDALTNFAVAVKGALSLHGITGADGREVDHIEISSAALSPENDSRNFVLCPGNAYDRSPCGTGTSAKLACLAADGKLAPGQVWRQEGILGTVFEGSYQLLSDANERVIPSITGSAWITAESRLMLQRDDPFRTGIHAPAVLAKL